MPGAVLRTVVTGVNWAPFMGLTGEEGGRLVKGHTSTHVMELQSPCGQ